MSILVAVGRVGAPHGLNGWLKVEPLTDDPERFSSLEYVCVSLANEEPRRFELEEIKYQPRHVLIKLEGVDDRDAAAKLSGAYIKIPESLVPPAGEDEYYYYQLQGLRVETTQGEHLGALDNITQSGGNDVYWILTPDGKDHRLVPALKRGIKEIDLQRGLMIVDKDWVV